MRTTLQMKARPVNTMAIQDLLLDVNSSKRCKRCNVNIFHPLAFRVMGAGRHGQLGEEGALAPPRKCCKVFCALAVTVKRSVCRRVWTQEHKCLVVWICSLETLQSTLENQQSGYLLTLEHFSEDQRHHTQR